MTAPHTIERTCIAPVNIACLKYWGKRDTELILPTNSSLSVTLNTDDLHSKTTIRADRNESCDKFYLNGHEVEGALESKTRMAKILSLMRVKRDQLERDGQAVDQVQNLSQWKLKIVSVNNFPTAAGLASSASGLACFVVTLAKVYGLLTEVGTIDQWTELSKLARMGSGSACRSVFGGFVKWEQGENEDGSDSFAVQVAPRSHWPEMRALILVTNDRKKAVSSTAGMQTTVETSQLFKERVKSVVQRNMADIEQGILERNFPLFANATMRDSNSFHAVCLDTVPPIFYLNDTSRDIVRWVDGYNEAAGEVVVAYTFDAGPNAVLYFLEKDSILIARVLSSFLDLNSIDTSSVKIPEVLQALKSSSASSSQSLSSLPIFESGTIKRIIYTSVGEGPQQVQESLLTADGNIKLQ